MDDDAARISSAVPGPLQTVQRAEYCRVVLGLQALMPVQPRVGNNKFCHKVATLLSEMPRRMWWPRVGHAGGLGDVDDSRLAPRRRLRSNTSVQHLVGRDVSPTPKRKKWTFLRESLAPRKATTSLELE